MRRLLSEAEAELRSYVWKTEERIFELETKLASQEQDNSERHRQIDELLSKHSLELGEKDRAIRQLERCIEELSQHPSKQSQQLEQSKHKTVNKEESHKLQRGKPEGFLPNFLQQLSKSLEPSSQLHDKLSSFESGSLLLIERNKQLLDALKESREHIARLSDSVRQFGS